MKADNTGVLSIKPTAKNKHSARNDLGFAGKLQSPAIMGLVLSLVFATTVVSCGREQAAKGQEDQPMPSKSLEDVKSTPAA